MKVKKLIAGLVIASTPLLSFAAEPIKSEQQRLSYSLGVMLGERLAGDFETIELSSLIQGISDAIEKNKLVLSRGDMVRIIQDAQQKQAESMQKKMIEMAKKNLDAGNKFLEKNKSKTGVITTASGLQYKVIRQGNSKTKATPTSSVTVHYEGKKLDGEIFDSSYERGEPAIFKANQVIKGWTEALQLMGEGDEWNLYIPTELAYGPGGIPGKIGPNEVLTFKVELLKINNG